MAQLECCHGCGKPKERELLKINERKYGKGYRVCSRKCFQRLRDRKMMATPRKCESCGETKPLTDFYIRAKAISGNSYDYLCKECRIKRQRQNNSHVNGQRGRAISFGKGLSRTAFSKVARQSDGRKRDCSSKNSQ